VGGVAVQQRCDTGGDLSFSTAILEEGMIYPDLKIVRRDCPARRAGRSSGDAPFHRHRFREGPHRRCLRSDADCVM
jgi:hypothetical protein